MSAVSTWSKVNNGLIKMYKAEVIIEKVEKTLKIKIIYTLFQVLAKFPVIQHVFFGSLLPLTPMKNPTNSKTRLESPAAATLQ